MTKIQATVSRTCNNDKMDAKLSGGSNTMMRNTLSLILHSSQKDCFRTTIRNHNQIILELLYNDFTSILSDSAAISTSRVVFFCVFHFFVFFFFFDFFLNLLLQFRQSAHFCPSLVSLGITPRFWSRCFYYETKFQEINKCEYLSVTFSNSTFSIPHYGCSFCFLYG